MEKDAENTPIEEPLECAPMDAYRSAIEVYRESRRELAECEIEIEVGRITKDVDSLRFSLSRKNRLLGLVNDARARIQDAAVQVVRAKGMEPREEHEENKEGLLHKAVDIFSKIMKT